jgi:adenine-specific DNA-methyltransferase
MNWPGKAECFRTLQAPSLGTLRPCPEESVNFDTSENLIIEGDNLEVLKLLQKSYLGKVKMIYIDPPYNTGNDFIYPDNYSESLRTYLEYTGQVDAEAPLRHPHRRRRRHSKWLNMMYPRLYLARNLLGGWHFSRATTTSAQLRGLMNEVFGEENFIASVTKVYSPRTRQAFSEDHDYIVVYARHAEFGSQNCCRALTIKMLIIQIRQRPRTVRDRWYVCMKFYSKGVLHPCPSGRLIEGPPQGRYWSLGEIRSSIQTIGSGGALTVTTTSGKAFLSK